MKRKTIQLAKNTLVVSLPAKWVQEHGITKGQEVNIEAEGPSLILTRGEHPAQRTITINTTDLSERVIQWGLSSAHKKGYTEMTVNYENPKTLLTIQDYVKEVMLGFAIVDQRKNSCVIRAVAKEDPQEYDQTLRRAFLVTLAMGERIAEIMKEGKQKELPSTLELEKTNNQLTNFCSRLINKQQIKDDKTAFQYVIVWNLEKIADEFKYIVKHYANKKQSPLSEEVHTFFTEVNALLRGYYDLKYQFSHETLTKLSDEAKILTDSGYALLQEDDVLIHHLLKVVSHVKDFSSSLIALQG